MNDCIAEVPQNVPRYKAGCTAFAKQKGDSELRSMLTVDKDSLLREARRYTTCTSCLSAVRTLDMAEACIYTNLDSQPTRLGLRNCHYDITYQKTAKTLSLYGKDASRKWYAEHVVPSGSGKGRARRCRIHASFRKHVDQADWLGVWRRAPSFFRKRVTMINPEELYASIDTHLANIGFCKHCTTNVNDAFDIMIASATSDMEPPEDFDPLLFSNLHICSASDSGNNEKTTTLKKKKKAKGKKDSLSKLEIHVDPSTVPALVDMHLSAAARDEIALANNEEARHAMNMALAQEEVLNVIGSMVLWKIQTLVSIPREAVVEFISRLEDLICTSLKRSLIFLPLMRS